MYSAEIDRMEKHYKEILAMSHYDFPLRIEDHIGGIDINGRNIMLDRIQYFAERNNINAARMILDFPVLDKIKNNYPNLKFEYCHFDPMWTSFLKYKIHPEIEFENFACTFNRAAHVSRKLLVSALDKWGMFNDKFSSKMLVFDLEEIDGHIKDLTGDRENFYRKFIIDDAREQWYKTPVDIGRPSFIMIQKDHDQNLLLLEKSLTSSFLHIVSESMATSYHPFITEKFLYSVVTRGLFLAYGQQYWHQSLIDFYGFRLYDNIFDYRFDNILNPIERLIELLCMISKFSNLSRHDWHDLYQLESENIEYNYDHYFSERYLDFVKKIT